MAVTALLACCTACWKACKGGLLRSNMLSVRSEEDAFKNSVECITGPISRIISTQGMPAVYEALDAKGKEIFKEVRTARPCAVPVLTGRPGGS